MRLWHKDLVSVLPKQQLVAQWRELSAIVGAINKKGTPNHLLVNKILDYDKKHLLSYTVLIMEEMKNRNYKPSSSVFKKIYDYTGSEHLRFYEPYWYDKLYENWHNRRYLEQCYNNLQEKYDCGGITQVEWNKIEIEYKKSIKYYEGADENDENL